MLGILARGSGYIAVGQLLLMCFPLITVPGFVSLLIAVAAGDTLFRLSFLLVVVAFLVVPLLVGMRC